MHFDDTKRSLFKRKKEITTDNLLPWIIDAQQFLEKCTQCADCISVCPENIIIKGDGGFPNIDFDLGECVFCGKCADVCKEPIFTATSASPWQKKALIKQTCLAHENIYCRSCAESCEAQALTFQLGISAIPIIDTDLCIGCGACVAPCPTKAIEIKELK
ncbi:ferredoxin-type protein NapF [Psychromonas sp. Urea-02u-13]|uniref:ferredoxin-type protein NapF n=1 Tax=Psychromonas sp. Urea-02u-13 TaxID=2058326 RepID=UPI001E443056|nr:ferredoxin-type protein NapF [Psychromonas sp. Urea-02u-13]